jgi:plastocyanin
MSVRMIFALVVVLLATACGGSTSPTPTTPTPTPTAAPTLSASTSTVAIVSGASTMTNTAYSPNPINITPGTTVSWVNNDNTTHTSTGNAGIWSSGSIAPGDRFSFTFQSAGTFSYHCSIHPNMVGTVNVQ